jgi:ABC-2 type transport system ATP-binding protein
MGKMLEVIDLTGGYSHQRPVLHNLTLEVNSAEIVGLIGLNGAGKSTTIKHILGLIEPISGTTKVNGRTLMESRDEYRSQIAFIPETPVLYNELTLWEHLRLTAMAYGLDERTFRNRTAPLLKEFRMEKMVKWFPSQFSKGMRQKVMIMCAFLIKPSLYIVDEPFVGLDPLGIQSFLDLMVDAKNAGAGVLMSTHILSTAERYCDRFVVLHEGRIQLSGTLEEMQRKLNMPSARLDDIYIEATRGEH